MKENTFTLVFLLLTSISFAQMDLTSGLVGHYPFNGNANDESGNGHHAVSVNATLTTDRYGRENMAYYFDGDEDVINLGNIFDNTFSSNTFSISVWFNTEDYYGVNGYAGMLMSKWNSSNQPQNSFTLRGYPLRFYSGVNTGELPVFETPETGTWNMMTVSMDDGEASIYLNGELKGVVSGHICYPSSRNLLIGNLHNFMYGFNGVIDDVRFYDRPLSDEEVNYLYNINLDEGLIAYYPFNGNAENEVSDEFHGIPQQNPALTNDRLGFEEQAYSFNGSNQYIAFPSANPIITTPTFTISAWARMDGIGGGNHSQNPIFTQRANATGTTSAIGLYADALNGKAHFAVRGHGAKEDEISVPAREFGQWHHYLGVVDSDSVKFYINGDLIGAVELTTTTSFTENIHTIAIGRHQVSGITSGLFNGDIDEVRIYSRPLNYHEIQALYYETLRAEFVADKNDGFVPLAVGFEDYSFSDMDITSWQWDFTGDGIIDSEEQNPVFTYETGGAYSVKLIVSDGTHADSIILKDLVTVYDLNNSLIRHYKFDGNALDGTDNEEHGEAYGAEVTDRYGIPESAYAFNGENNVTVPSIGNWGEQLTISFWFYVEETTGNQVLFGSREGSLGATPINMRSFLQDDGTVSFQVTSDNTNNTDVTSSNTAEMFAWNHVICELDLVNNTETIILNSIETSKSYTYTPRYLDQNIGFGNWKEPYASTNGLIGKIDEIHFYDRVLFQKEKEIISTHDFPMAQNLGVIAAYPFNGDAVDATGNGNDGQVNRAMLTLDRYRNTSSAYNFSYEESHIDIGTGVKSQSFPIYITAWVNPTATEGENTIVATDIWEANGVLAGTTVKIVDGHIFAAFGAWDGGETSSFKSKTATDVNIPVEEWTHIAVGFHSSDDIRTYINGELADGTYDGDATGVLYTSYGNAFIGNVQDFSTSFKGDLDEVHILNRYLYACEIEQMVNQPGISVSQKQMDFYNVSAGDVSVEQVFSVYGLNLTDDIAIQAPEGFLISLSTGTGFSQNLTISPNEGLVDITPVFVRFEPIVEQTYSGEIVVASDGLNDVMVALSGSIPTFINEEKGLSAGVYPNPFSDVINIVDASHIKRVTLVNMVGMVLMDRVAAGQPSLILPTDGLKAGLYLIIFHDSNGKREVKKMIKH